METKFTKGPWSVVDDGKSISLWASESDCIINEQLHAFPCEDYVLECKANLYLAAAAPDMYEALVALSKGEGLEPGTTIEKILIKARGE